MTKSKAEAECNSCGNADRKPEEYVYRPVREAIDDLRKHEEKILEALKKKGGQDRFMRSPQLVLSQLKIPVPSVLAHHLRATSGLSLDATTPPCSVVLPNGQRIRPRVSVHISNGKTKG